MIGISALLRLVDSQVDSNVSENYTVSIFRAEDGDGMLLRNVGIEGETTEWNYDNDKKLLTFLLL
jgi:hypothetical protein